MFSNNKKLLNLWVVLLYLHLIDIKGAFLLKNPNLAPVHTNSFTKSFKFALLVLFCYYCNSFNLYNVINMDEMSRNSTGGKGIQVEKRMKNLPLCTHVFSRIFTSRELKRRRRRRQRQRRKTTGLMSKNNRSARAFYILVHFFAVLCKTRKWNDHIKGFVENVNARRWISHFLSSLVRPSYQFGSWIVHHFCKSWASWNDREVAQMK